MYAPPAYRARSLKRMLDVIDVHSFAVLVSCTDGAIMATHLPILLDRRESDDPAGMQLLGHFAKANRQARSLRDGDEVLAIFSGPAGYISARWYSEEEDVPTYNYSAVHARGRYRRIVPGADAHGLLETTVRHYEGEGEDAWRMSDIDPRIVSRFEKGVTCFAIEKLTLEGAFKHSQDKSASDQEAVLSGLAERGGREDESLVAQMRRSLKAGDET